MLHTYKQKCSGNISPTKSIYSFFHKNNLTRKKESVISKFKDNS